ncbi:MAG: peptidoglycan-binding protein, partial [Candidatus Paceibacterota bacterium]
APTKAGFTFASWNTLLDGTGTAFDATTVVTADVTVYAQWTALSMIATVTSTSYTVDSTANTITNVANATDVTIFKTNLTPATGATFEVYETDGITARVGNVITGDKVIVTAQDTITKKTYIITVDTVLPTVIKLGDGTVDVTIAQSGTATLVFSEAIKSASRVGIENALTNGADKVITFVWNLAGDTLTINGNASGITTFANDVIVASISDLAGNISTEVLLIDSTIEAGQAAPSGGSVVLNPTTPQAVITDPVQAVGVIVNSGTTGSTINVDSFINNGTGILPQITITANNAGNVIVSIPSGTTVTSSDSGWTGIFSTPQTTSATFSGEIVGIALQLGSAGNSLTFDKGVRILLPSQAGKRIKFSIDGVNYAEITNICSADSQVIGDALSAGGDCKIDAGSDLVIWTKHFTSFVTFTVAPSGGSSGGGGGGGGAVIFTSSMTTPKIDNPIEKIISPSYSNIQVDVIAKKISEVRLSNNSILKALVDSTKYGQTNLNVKILQEVLKHYGFLSENYISTGYYDQETSSAVRQYKRIYVDSLLTDEQLESLANKIAEIDIRDNKTLRALVDATRYDERSLRVKILQQVLKVYGFFPKEITSTGYYDGYTTIAVEEYNKLYVDIILTDKQLESLGKAIAEVKLKDNTILKDLIISTGYGQRSLRVKILQQVLKVYGFFPKEITSTGYYDGYTSAAIKKMQDFLLLNKKYLDMFLLGN